MSSHIASTGHIQGLSWSLVNHMRTSPFKWGHLNGEVLSFHWPTGLGMDFMRCSLWSPLWSFKHEKADTCPDSRNGFPESRFLDRMCWLSQMSGRDDIEYSKGGLELALSVGGRLSLTQAKSLLINSSLVLISYTSDHTFFALQNQFDFPSQILTPKHFHMCKHLRVAFQDELASDKLGWRGFFPEHLTSP